jgi:hypothetical protein
MATLRLRDPLTGRFISAAAAPAETIGPETPAVAPSLPPDKRDTKKRKGDSAAKDKGKTKKTKKKANKKIEAKGKKHKKK